MLRALCAVFAIVAVVLGVYVWQLSSEASTLREQLATAQKEAESAHVAEKAARQQVDAIRLAEAKAAAPDAALADQGGQPSALSANAGAKSKGPSNPMAKAMESEAGKKLIKDQIGRQMKGLYGDLVRKLNLSPEEADKLMNLLTERSTEMAGNPWKYMKEGGLDADEMKKMKEEAEATKKNYDSMLKNELGDAGFQEFQDYEKGIGERVMLTQIEQMGAGTFPQEQRDRLLQVMADERKKSPPSPIDSSGRDTAGNMEAIKDNAVVEKWLKDEDDYHQRVLQQASSILNPDQVKSLQQGLDQFANMQKLGIKMGQEMMKANAAKNAPPK